MNRIECLDGLRGLAALWVLIGHCMILTGFYLPILGKPDLGVDLFILLSGFLMVFQYQLRSAKEDWGHPSAWVSFWIRRFFRISPLYFCLLVVSLVIGKQIYADRVLIDSFLGQPLQLSQRYTDLSATNLLMHVTYAFGLVPDYAYRTPLPDWSLGLEMQFYAVFPFTVLVARKLGWLITAIVVTVLSLSIAFVSHRMGVAFPMPSFLPLKMQLFVAGMLIAAAAGRASIPYFALALVLGALPVGGAHDVLHIVVRECVLTGFFVLVHGRAVGWIDRLSSLLGSPPFHWLGELSFGVYLVHLLILHPVAGWIIGHWGHAISSNVRFEIAFAVVAPLAYGIAYVTYRCIEMPGQRWGRYVLQSLKRRGLQTRALTEV